MTEMTRAHHIHSKHTPKNWLQITPFWKVVFLSASRVPTRRLIKRSFFLSLSSCCFYTAFGVWPFRLAVARVFPAALSFLIRCIALTAWYHLCHRRLASTWNYLQWPVGPSRNKYRNRRMISNIYHPSEKREIKENAANHPCFIQEVSSVFKTSLSSSLVNHGCFRHSSAVIRNLGSSRSSSRMKPIASLDTWPADCARLSSNCWNFNAKSSTSEPFMWIILV